MPDFYVVSPAALPNIEPYTADTVEQAAEAGVRALGLTGGVIAVVPADDVRMYDVAAETHVTVTPRASAS